jgi:hypothetical protein
MTNDLEYWVFLLIGMLWTANLELNWNGQRKRNWEWLQTDITCI